MDERKLKVAGQKSPVNWLVFIVPVYLWKRADLLNQKKHYFWAWIAAFVLSIMIGTGGNQAILIDGNLPHYITPSSKPVAGFKMPSIGKQVVTFAEYKQVQNTMLYERVVAIIGCEGEEMTRNKM